jgi:arylsulfatase
MPNVIFIMVDTLRADHLHCYGYTRQTSPNIDKFAAESTRYMRAISQAPMTKMSVPSFLSSEYPQDRGNAFETSLVQAFRSNGYVTGAVISNLEAARAYGVKDLPWDFWDEKLTMNDVTSPQVTSKSLDWISKQSSKPGHPFFLFALYMDPHTPYIRHAGHIFDPEYNGKYRDRIDIPEAAILKEKPPCSVEHFKATYDSEIAFTDEHIGKLIDELKKRGLYDNTLIVFLADHGEEFSDHGDFFHAKTLYSEVLSVPLVIKLPNQHEGRTVGGIFSLIDLAPSILNNLGIDPACLRPQGSVVDLKSAAPLKDKYIYSACVPTLRSVQNAQYSMIRGCSPIISAKDTAELYDLRNDPHELHNIAKAKPNVSSSMSQLLLKQELFVEKSIRKASKTEKIPVTDLEKTRLKSLGYLGN